MVSIDSCFAGPMKAQVLTTITCADSGSRTSEYPRPSRVPSITSESTRFLGQPKVARYNVFAGLSDCGPFKVISAPDEVDGGTAGVTDGQRPVTLQYHGQRLPEKASRGGPLQNPTSGVLLDQIERQSQLFFRLAAPLGGERIGPSEHREHRADTAERETGRQRHFRSSEIGRVLGQEASKYFRCQGHVG